MVPLHAVPPRCHPNLELNRCRFNTPWDRVFLNFLFLKWGRLSLIRPPREDDMEPTTLLFLIVVILLIFGGGWYGLGRWY
jgi:hypothetical protein